MNTRDLYLESTEEDNERRETMLTRIQQESVRQMEREKALKEFKMKSGRLPPTKLSSELEEYYRKEYEKRRPFSSEDEKRFNEVEGKILTNEQITPQDAMFYALLTPKITMFEQEMVKELKTEYNEIEGKVVDERVKKVMKQSTLYGKITSKEDIEFKKGVKTDGKTKEINEHILSLVLANEDLEPRFTEVKVVEKFKSIVRYGVKLENIGSLKAFYSTIMDVKPEITNRSIYIRTIYNDGTFKGWFTVNPNKTVGYKAFKERILQIMNPTSYGGGDGVGSDAVGGDDELPWFFDFTYAEFGTRKNIGMGGKRKYMCCEVIDRKVGEYPCIWSSLLNSGKLKKQEIEACEKTELIDNDGNKSLLPFCPDLSTVALHLIENFGVLIKLWHDYPNTAFDKIKYDLEEKGNPCARLKDYKLLPYSKTHPELDFAAGRNLVTPRTIDLIYKNEHVALFSKMKEILITPNHEYMDEGKWIKIKTPKTKKVPSLLIGFDFETVWKSDTHVLVPYSVHLTIRISKLESEDGLSEEDKNLRKAGKDKDIFIYGSNCVSDMLDELNAYSNFRQILIGYNSSRFDNFLLPDEMIKRDMLRDIFYVGNSILSIKWGHKFNQTFDLVRYTACPLSKACEAFNTKNKKIGDFNHRDIQNHFITNGTLDTFFSETDEKTGKKKLQLLKEYNLMDVHSMLEIYDKVEETFKSIAMIKNGESLYHTLTIGSMVYKKFKADLKEKKIVMPALTPDWYRCVRKSLVAGRTQAYLGAYYSPESQNQLFNMIDVVSLYPYVMLYRDFPCGEIVDISFEECMKKDLIGFYECKVDQTNLWYIDEKGNRRKKNILPLRSKEKPLDWSTDEITHWPALNTIDIKRCIKEGCKVEIGKGFAFSDKIKGAELFSSIKMLKDIKQKEDLIKKEIAKENKKRKAGGEQEISEIEIDGKMTFSNPAMRQIAKLGMNSLSGKLIERLHEVTTVLVQGKGFEDRVLKKTSDENSIELLHTFSGSGKALVRYNISFEDAFNKNGDHPIYLGVLIYAYARDHMYETVISKSNIIYQDTDSALLKKEEFERLDSEYKKEKGRSILGEEFGEFTKEEAGCEKTTDFTSALVLAPKNYFLFVKGKVGKKGFKGVNLDKDKWVPHDHPDLVRDKNGDISGIKNDHVNYEKLLPIGKCVDKIIDLYQDSKSKDSKKYYYVLCNSLKKNILSIAKGDSKQLTHSIENRYVIKTIEMSGDQF